MPPVPRSSLDPARRLSGWLDRRVRDLPPGRRLRQLLALELVERHAAGRDGALTVLDAGCEEGLLCLELARRHPGWRLVAADLAAPALRRGRRWALEEGLVVSFVQLDVTRSLGTAAYDVVLSLECLEEVPDDQAALRAMATALRPGGLFVVHVPTADWSPVLKGAARTWRREVRHGYDADELRSRLEALGLGVLEVSPTFRRTTALAQDLRDACKGHRRRSRLLLPLMAGAVRLERAGLTWGPARGLLVVAVKPAGASTSGGPDPVGQAAAEPAYPPSEGLHPQDEAALAPQ